MAFRFRRSKKIAPGVRINVSKKSIGLSVGGKGLRHSINTSGRRTTTAGIPGTGMSYSKSHSSRKGRKTNSSQALSKNASNQSNEASQLVEEYEQHIKALQELHLRVSEPINWKEKASEAPPFSIGEIGPHETDARRDVEQYKPSFFSRLLKKEAKEMAELEEKLEHAILKDKESYSAWLNRVNKAQTLAAGGVEVYKELLDETDLFQTAEEYGAAVELVPIDRSEVIFTFLVNDHVIPDETFCLTKTGKLSRKAQTKTNYYHLYQQFICSLLLKAARDCLHALPDVTTVHCHVEERRIDPADGHHKNSRLIEVTFTRAQMESKRFEHIDAQAAVAGYDPAWKFIKTKGFQPIR
ncbi:DUF4236 domain-containing protein [Alkalihalophilus pseudofirmus]|uniref:DUF4236 domain-containing protein n=1 Tax=Alkalihalophilus pseudofirmus TaxID=79885 RepID=A0AAJ2NKX9_ALKPS|nr:DUF4236 domain-containing protein [Alkalihalophilus pseudofirmus]MDV2884779.1 DUF4236 domain-containing protein [Alkalihalophilus pseudofirmus]